MKKFVYRFSTRLPKSRLNEVYNIINKYYLPGFHDAKIHLVGDHEAPEELGYVFHNDDCYCEIGLFEYDKTRYEFFVIECVRKEDETLQHHPPIVTDLFQKICVKGYYFDNSYPVEIFGFDLLSGHGILDPNYKVTRIQDPQFFALDYLTEEEKSQFSFFLNSEQFVSLGGEAVSEEDYKIAYYDNILSDVSHFWKDEEAAPNPYLGAKLARLEQEEREYYEDIDSVMENLYGEKEEYDFEEITDFISFYEREYNIRFTYGQAMDICYRFHKLHSLRFDHQVKKYLKKREEFEKWYEKIMEERRNQEFKLIDAEGNEYTQEEYENHGCYGMM